MTMESADVDLSVNGISCHVLLDDTVAARVEEGELLIAVLTGLDLHEELWIDKTDVRNHITNWSENLNSAVTDGDCDEFVADKYFEEEHFEDLLYERYQDLIGRTDDDLPQDDAIEKAHKVPTEIHEQVIRPTYISNREEIWDKSVLQEQYEIAPCLALPPEIKKPRTKKQYDVIMHTARTVRERGIQLEILLKVRQEDNMAFDFLYSEHVDYPFYSFIKSLGEKQFWDVFLWKDVEVASDCSAPNDLETHQTEKSVVVTEAKNALSLLTMYSDEEDNVDIEEDEIGGGVNDHINSNDPPCAMLDCDDVQINPFSTLHMTTGGADSDCINSTGTPDTASIDGLSSPAAEEQDDDSFPPPPPPAAAAATVIGNVEDDDDDDDDSSVSCTGSMTKSRDSEQCHLQPPNTEGAADTPVGLVGDTDVHSRASILTVPHDSYSDPLPGSNRATSRESDEALEFDTTQLQTAEITDPNSRNEDRVEKEEHGKQEDLAVGEEAIVCKETTLPVDSIEDAKLSTDMAMAHAELAGALIEEIALLQRDLAVVDDGLDEDVNVGKKYGR